MKQQDLLAVAVIVILAGFFSFFISNKFITPSDQKQSAETVSAINPEFNLPDDKVFNPAAINPTVKIEIAPGNNTNPFANEDQ